MGKHLKKKTKIKYLLFTVLGLISGVVIGGIVGVTATTNKLEAKYVMYTKDGKTMTVQDAIKDLYVLAKNNEGGSSQTLPLGDVTVSGTQITIPYTGTYDKITCVYGTTQSYGSTGTISGNTCTFTGNSNTKYYYKLIATKIANNTGTVYENSGNKTTLSGPTAVKTELPTGVKAIVYLDPTDLSKACDASNSTVGSGTSGCMKWYAFSEDSTSYTMILDHNTYTRGSQSDALLSLLSLPWNNLNTRMITADEVKDIQKNITTKSDYYWLFDYTSGCIASGCKVEDSSNKGYWTSTKYSNSNMYYYVSFNGSLKYESGWSYGARPVITVQKSDL